MGTRNQTSGSTFTLQSITNAEQQRLLFVLFLGLYLVTVVGNLLIVLTIRTDSRLHSPMYFFLANLSLVDICFSCTTVPSLLGTLFTGHQDISYGGCLAQMYFFIAFGITESCLLAAMAYDRYLAICNPLLYSVVMSPQRCVLLVVTCWLVSHLHSLLHTLLMTQMTFCASREIPLFFCDVFPLLKISCSDPHINFLVVYTEGAVIVNSALLMVLASYAHIVPAVLRVPSAHGKRKAFSTCSSHLAAVGLFYGTVIWVYFQPSSSFSSERDTIATVIYTTITPLLNPFIYSLRNRDLHRALHSWPCAPRPCIPGPGPQDPETPALCPQTWQRGPCASKRSPSPPVCAPDPEYLILHPQPCALRPCDPSSASPALHSQPCAPNSASLDPVLPPLVSQVIVRRPPLKDQELGS